MISDITLPDGNGLDFGKNVREKSDVRLIYLTAMDQEIDIVNGYDTGADDYVSCYSCSYEHSIYFDIDTRKSGEKRILD